MKNFNGTALFLDRADINTDEIIPAKYLTEVTKEALQPHLFEDIKLDGFTPQKDTAGKNVIISRTNFGCGSSREHAPWALEVNGINLVIAESFARIFRQNMFNCGLMAVELSAKVIERLFHNCSRKHTVVTTDVAKQMFHITAEGFSEQIPFSLSAFDRDLVTAGGWLEYADQRY